MNDDFKLDNADDIATIPELEKDGVVLDYGDGRWIKVARAGGHNHAFARIAQAHQKPYKYQIDNDTLPAEKRAELNRLIYADACVKDFGGWKVAGQELSYSKENARKLMSVGGVYDFVIDKAVGLASFRRAEIEQALSEAKND